MIKLTLIQEDKYGEKYIETAVDNFDGARAVAGELHLNYNSIEIIFHLPKKKEDSNDPV